MSIVMPRNSPNSASPSTPTSPGTLPRIILTRRWPVRVEAELEALGEVRLRDPDIPMSRQELVDALSTADVLCPTVTDRLSADLFEQADKRTRLIANFGVGFNHIDLEAARKYGAAVSNTPGVLTDATAEIALTLLLMSARRAAEGERLVRSGQWDGWHPTHMLSAQVTGKTLGIVGMGRIGTALARQAHHGLGMNILYTKRGSLHESVELELGARRCDLQTLLSSADFVSVHCPATPETKHLLNSTTLAWCQPHVHIINTARGDIVDEGALVEALRSGQIAGAGLDVYENEPLLASGLADLERVVLLPHMGSGTVETREAMGRCAIANVRAYIEGDLLPNEVG